MNFLIKILCVTCLTLLFPKTHAQTDTIRQNLILTLSKYIRSNYVSADIAKQMCDTIELKSVSGEYDAVLNLDEFAFEITKDLRRISKDEHISVTRPIYKQNNTAEEYRKIDSWKKFEKFKAQYRKRTKDDKFSYGEIKILPGNVGYVEIKDFNSTSYDKKQNKGRIRIDKVMKLLKHSNTIILDLRDNQGGYISQAARFCSYFSPATRNYFITTKWHFRHDSSGVEKEWTGVDKMLTSDKIDNSLTKSKAIYILTSHRTFSAAELSTYKIKEFNPAATIIGEKTKGGANGHSGGTTEKYFSAIIPSLTVYDESKSNYTFEATGITPDIMTLADSAFTVAYRLALKDLTPKNTKVKYFKKQNTPIATYAQYFRKLYPDYLGDYRKIKIMQEGDNLFMIYDTYDKIQLVPEAVDFFTADRIQYVKFLRDSNHRVASIQVRHTNEFMEEFKRQ